MYNDGHTTNPQIYVYESNNPPSWAIYGAAILAVFDRNDRVTSRVRCITHEKQEFALDLRVLSKT